MPPLAPLNTQLSYFAPVCTLLASLRVLFASLSCTCHMYTPSMPMSTPGRYRRTLEKLTGEPPATKTALIAILLPEIETALASGKTRRQSGSGSSKMDSISVTTPSTARSGACREDHG